jgi:hypothetical protein
MAKLKIERAAMSKLNHHDPEYILVIRQEVSPEDEALLRERLRIIASGKGLWLKDMVRTIPHSASFLFSYRADLEFSCDLFRILGWLEDKALTLDDLMLCDQILDKWDKSQRRSNPLWNMPEPSEEYLALNRRVRKVAERLIAKGQYKEHTE